MIDIKDVKKENIINTKENKNKLLEYLKANFPQTISDNVPNLNAIMQLLGLNTKAQGYELTFTGKALANALYSTPNTKELKFHSHLSKDSENTKNVIIKGDNLDALKLLKSAYYEKIKMIYIDPPYNTKNDNFIYNDDFRKDYKELLIQTGLLEIDEEGQEIESETLRFFNSIKSSKTHSGWLCFMLPRLKLARDLLKEDGVIFISIDDNEQANLKILCDEIFGEENFCGQIIWLKGNAQNDADTIQGNHEYILCYAKDIATKPIYQIKQKVKVKVFKDEKIEKFYYEGSGLTTGGAGGTLNARPNLGYSIYYNPKTKDFFAKDDYDKELAKISNNEEEVYMSELSFLEDGYEIIRPPKKGVGLGRWTWALDKFNTSKSDILIRKNNNGYVVLKKEWLNSKQIKKDENGEYYALIEKESPSKSFIDFVGSSKGVAELKELIRNKAFNNPKNTKLINHFLKLSTNPNQNDIILDFFAGSGTTAQAVMELNAQDNGNRKFILVQLDEKIDENKSKIAYDFCKNELNSQNPVISDITIERVKRAGEKILKENVDKNLDLGFKVFSLVEKPELTKDDLNALNLKHHEHLTPYEKALNLALQEGKTLDKDLKIILEDKLYSCQDCFYIVNCDDEVLEFLRKTQNENVYINGYDDINLEDYLNLESFLKERLKVVY